MGMDIRERKTSYIDLFLDMAANDPHDPMRGIAEYIRNCQPGEASEIMRQVRPLALLYFREMGQEDMIFRYDLDTEEVKK